jgi:hypothetical protein
MEALDIFVFFRWVLGLGGGDGGWAWVCLFCRVGVLLVILS